MTNSVILDNWTLQDIGLLTQSGMIDEESTFLVANRRTNSFEYTSRRYYTVQIECLLKLLNDIVLRDSILIDSRSSGAWRGLDAIEELCSKNIIRFIDPPNPQLLARLCRTAVKTLCTPSDMACVTSDNDVRCQSYVSAVDNIFSQIVLGLAGYLGKSTILEVPYSAHPTRNLLLDTGIFAEGQRDITKELVEWTKAEGTSALGSHSPGNGPVVAQLIVPPIAAEVIENTDTMSRMVRSAMDARRKYGDLRKWISEYQYAIDQEDFRDILKRRKLIRSVSENIQRQIGPSPNGKTKLSFGFASFRISNSLSMPHLNQKWGIRKTFNNLVLAKRGRTVLRKLVRLCGEENPVIVQEASKYL